MKFRDKLAYLLERDKITVPKLSEATGISSQTFYSILKRDGDKTKLSHLRKICNYFNVSLDYLVDDEIEDPDFEANSYPHALTITTEPDKTIAGKLITLSEPNKYKVEGVIDNYIREEKGEPPTLKIVEPEVEPDEDEIESVSIEVYEQAASAGIGNYCNYSVAREKSGL